MDYERMHKIELLPTFDEMRNFIGDTAVKEFDRIITFIEENYALRKEICYGGKNYGVLIRYKKGNKTLITLFPEKNSFSCFLIFGTKESKQFENRKNEFCDYLNTIFNETKQYHDGKWLLIRIEDEKYTDELIEMIKIKKQRTLTR
jgi:hypothetical protein